MPRAAMQPHCRAARPGGNGQFAVIQAMAPPHAVELTPINANDSLEIQTKRIAAFASSLNGGLIVTVGGTAVRRDVVITAAAKNRLPAVYPHRYFAADGGLISYGPDTIEQYRWAAGYVDRILKGEKPADLPVQRRRSTSLSLISRPPRRSASKCRRRSSRAPTR